MKVIKRDGREVEFDRERIVNAVSKAFSENGYDLKDSSVSGYISYLANMITHLTRITLEVKNQIISVETIQDAIVDELLDGRYRDVGKAYIEYRYLHKLARDDYGELMEAVSDKLTASNVQNQNANVDEHSFGGRIGEASSVLTKHYALKYLVSDMARNNHENNEIYIHDLDAYAVGSHNCLSIPFDDLLANGFNTRQTDVRPAQSVSTAFQLVAVIFQIQSLQQFGGVSATHLDWTMVPYVRKSFAKHYKDGLEYIDGVIDVPKFVSGDTPIDSNLYRSYSQGSYTYAINQTEREVYQAVEGMYHNLNTLQSRSGNQLPFSSLNYGTCTLPEGRMIIKALLDVSIKGTGRLHKTSIFPCGIFQCMKGVNQEKGDPNYDMFRLALRSTAQRLYPNYANVDWSGNAGYDKNDPRTYFSTMGCRTANGFDINGFGQLKDGRGNICPVTIILPTLAMEAKEQYNGRERIEDIFLNILNRKIHEAKDMLLERFEWICSQDPSSARFMYENNVMAGYVPSEGIRSALKHGTLAIGQLGLAECLQILIGKDHTTDEGMKLAKKIEELFKKRCSEFKEEYKLNFGVYYTPKIRGGLC